jgi:hypothetical protein
MESSKVESVQTFGRKVRTYFMKRMKGNMRSWILFSSFKFSANVLHSNFSVFIVLENLNCSCSLQEGYRHD